MKNLIAALALIIALSAIFSWIDYRPMKTAISDGYGAMRKGDSGPVIPGDGDQLADVDILPQSVSELSEGELQEDEPAEEVEAIKVIKQESSEESIQNQSEEAEEEENKMDGMCVFWHAVAAILIGQLSVPLVTFLLKKIKEGKTNEQN